MEPAGSADVIVETVDEFGVVTTTVRPSDLREGLQGPTASRCCTVSYITIAQAQTRIDSSAYAVGGVGWLR